MKKRSLALLVFIQSVLAMLGSLYYSNYGDPFVNALFQGPGLPPCELCWWARILMYPIVFISAVGLIRNDKNFIWYVLPLSIPAVGLEIYHYALQKFPIETSATCTMANPCDALKVDYFGIITIPFLCLMAALVITAAGIAFARANKEQEKTLMEKVVSAVTEGE